MSNNQLNNDELKRVAGGTSKDEIDIEIAKLERMIDALNKAKNKVNETFINMIINAISEYGIDVAITMANKLFANDDATRKMVLDIINQYK